MKSRAILCACLLLFVEPLSSQRPATPGRLTVKVTSTQETFITIDGQDTNQKTPATFAVSPGDHSVSLPGVPRCKAPKTITVSSGAPSSVNCDANAGWLN
jgi:hypothetical protein